MKRLRWYVSKRTYLKPILIDVGTHGSGLAPERRFTSTRPADIIV
jgi:hypothetical protein